MASSDISPKARFPRVTRIGFVVVYFGGAGRHRETPLEISSIFVTMVQDTRHSIATLMKSPIPLSYERSQNEVFSCLFALVRWIKSGARRVNATKNRATTQTQSQP